MPTLAIAEVDKWTTTLTIGSSGNLSGYRANTHGHGFGTLSPDTFTYLGTDYKIETFLKSSSSFTITFRSGNFSVRLPSSLENNAHLHLTKGTGTHLDVSWGDLSWTSFDYYSYTNSTNFRANGNTETITIRLPPGPPESVTATWKGEVSWESGERAASYNLRYRPAGSVDPWTEHQNVTSPYTIEGLTYGTMVDMQVASVNPRATVWSDTQPFTWYGTSIPAKPASPDVLDIEKTQLKVTFKQDDADYESFDYQFNYRKMSGGSFLDNYATFDAPFVGLVRVKGTISGLEADTAYVIRLRACHDSTIEETCGAPLVVRTTTAPEIALEPPPSGLSATASEGSSAIALS